MATFSPLGLERDLFGLETVRYGFAACVCASLVFLLLVHVIRVTQARVILALYDFVCHPLVCTVVDPNRDSSMRGQHPLSSLRGKVIVFVVLMNCSTRVSVDGWHPVFGRTSHQSRPS